MKHSVYSEHELSNWRQCNHCGYQAEMLLICQGAHTVDTDDYHVSQVFKILKCRSCSALVVVQFVANIFDDLYDRTEDDPQIITYRERTLFAQSKMRPETIPSAIAEVAGQAESTANISPRAAVILCRAALEEICRERGVHSQGSLQQRLDRLFQQEGLPQEIREIMHAIRLLGNEGAHGEHTAFTRDV